MAANPSGAHQAGRHRAGPTLPGMPGKEAEGARCRAARPLPVWMSIDEGSNGTLRFATTTDSVAAARSAGAADMFRAITRTVLFDHTAASSSMNRVHDTSDAVARVAGPCPVHRDVDERRRPRRQARQIPGYLGSKLPPP